MKIPPDVRPVRDSRLDLIRVIASLHDKLVDGEESLKAKVKAVMAAKGAAFAESDLAVAALRGGAAKGSIDPARLYKLVSGGKLSMSQFLECVTVRRKPLEQHLAGEQIDRLTVMSGQASPSLTVEFKPGAAPDLDHLVQVISDALCAAPATA